MSAESFEERRELEPNGLSSEQAYVHFHITRTTEGVHGRVVENLKYPLTKQEVVALAKMARMLNLKGPVVAFEVILNFIENANDDETLLLNSVTFEEKVKLVLVYLIIRKKMAERNVIPDENAPFNGGEIWEPTFEPLESGDDEA